MEYGARSHAEHNLVWIGIMLVVGALVLFVAWKFWPDSLGATDVSVGAKTFRADVADTEERRSAGVTGLGMMSDDQALLMVYDYNGEWPVRTEGNKFSVDIAWISEGKKVVYVAKDARPSSTRTYKPGGKSRYVLIVPAGAMTKYNISPGKTVNFEHGA